jgi:hypothetical protein
MAIFKASYTKKANGAKASIRYIQHRPGKEGAKITRTLFGVDGLMGRWQAYQMIDEAEKGSQFFRFVISPDPKAEDSEQDLHLREITEKTMDTLEKRLQKQVSWVAVEHADHAPHRHVHVVAVVPGSLQVHDFQSLRTTATASCLEQRRERDLVREQQVSKRDEVEWEITR